MEPNHGGCSGQGDVVCADLAEPMMKPSRAAAEGSVSTTEADESTLACSDDACGSPLSVAAVACAVAAAPGLWETFLQLQQDADAYCEWAEVEADLSARLDGKPHAVALLRSVYRLGVQQAPVLRALACLAGGNGADDKGASLGIVAAYFCLDQMTDTTRLACLRLLVVLNSPLDAEWQVAEPALREALDFVLDAGEWEFLRHSELAYLDELRSMVRFLRERRAQPMDPGNDVTLTGSGGEGVHADFPLRIQWTTSLDNRRQTPSRIMMDGSKLSTYQSRENLRQLELQLKSQLQESLNMSHSDDFNSTHDEDYPRSDETRVIERDSTQPTESYVGTPIMTRFRELTVSEPPSDICSIETFDVSAQNSARSDGCPAATGKVSPDVSEDTSNTDVRKAPNQSSQDSLMPLERLAAVTALMSKFVPSIPIPGIFQQAGPMDSTSDTSIEHGDIWNKTLSKAVGQP